MLAFFSWLIEGNKKFSVVGNSAAVTTKDFFALIDQRLRRATSLTGLLPPGTRSASGRSVEDVMISGMAQPRVVDVKVRCAVCQNPATVVQLAPPGMMPPDFDTWDRDRQDLHRRYHDSDKWQFIYKGIEAGNGCDDIVADRAAMLAAAFEEPLTYEKVKTSGLYDDAGFCSQCRKPYCFTHWNAGDGSGTCPQGHWRSLDPHWHPPDDLSDW